VANDHRLLAVLGELVQTTAGTWITHPPTRAADAVGWEPIRAAPRPIYYSARHPHPWWRADCRSCSLWERQVSSIRRTCAL